MKVLLPDTISLNLHLPEEFEPVVVDASEAIPPKHRDAEILVAWGPSHEHLASAAHDLTHLRLVQSLSSGVETILNSGFSSEVAIANGAGLHDRTVAEHTLALVLAQVRRLPEVLEHQHRHDWSRELGGIQPLHTSDRVTTLLGARVVIWGFGSIGQTIAPLLSALGATVTGIARSAGERRGFPVIAASEVSTELPRTDVLISVLPSTDATLGVIGNDVFDQLPERAIFANVGRGDIVDQRALSDALRTGAIASAAIDVTAPEPLPHDDPLWDAPNLIITPHAAGGRPVGAEALIERNLTALSSNQHLENLVSR